MLVFLAILATFDLYSLLLGSRVDDICHKQNILKRLFLVLDSEMLSVLILWHLVTGLHKMCQPASLAWRKWRENEKMKRKWRAKEEMESEWGNGEEMDSEWGNGQRFTLYISSFSLYFLLLYPFPISKIVSFCRKMLNTALLSQMSQKNLTYVLMRK